MCKQSNIGNSFATSHQKTDVQSLPGKQGLSYVTVSQKDKCSHSKLPSAYSLFSSAFITVHDSGAGHPFG